ncbi:MAG: hypothetical protein ACFCVK_09860 [Acidimicrobiales bacterium]
MNAETSDDLDDDRLLDELRTAVNAFDPVPDRLMAAARAAFVWRTVDEELAHLQFDSLAGSDEVLVRTGGSSVHLSFATSGASVEIEIGPEALLGQVVPPAMSIRLVRADGGADIQSCDGEGQFRFPRPVSGPVRLVATVEGGDIVTEWFTV